MTKLIATALFLFALPIACPAQILPGGSPAEPVPVIALPAPALPTYLTGIGGAYNRWTSPPAGALISIAIRVGGSNLYSWSTIDTPIAASTAGGPPPASIRTGAAYVAAQSGRASLFFLGDAGLSTGSGTAALGSFSGGGGVLFRLWPNWYVGPVLRALKVSSTAVQPVAEFMIFRSF